MKKFLHYKQTKNSSQWIRKWWLWLSLSFIQFTYKIKHMWRRWAHLRISFWHLLMNLKNIIYLKNCWSGPIKSEIILIFTMSHFFRKKKKKINWRYHYQNFDDMIYSSWNIEQNRLKLVILGHFLPFHPPPLKTRKIKFWKNEKNPWAYYHFIHVCVP